MPTVDIPLRGGLVALVDSGDAELVSGYTWRAMKRGHTHYAVRGHRLPGGKYELVLMHRFILNIADGSLQVDHRNADGLDNRRRNLRVCSREENHQNARRRSDNESGLKGVTFDARIRRYIARIFINKKATYLGCFRTADEAHAAYRRAAELHFGEFARFD